MHVYTLIGVVLSAFSVSNSVIGKEIWTSNSALETKLIDALKECYEPEQQSRQKSEFYSSSTSSRNNNWNSESNKMDSDNGRNQSLSNGSTNTMNAANNIFHSNPMNASSFLYKNLSHYQHQDKFERYSDSRSNSFKNGGANNSSGNTSSQNTTRSRASEGPSRNSNSSSSMDTSKGNISSKGNSSSGEGLHESLWENKLLARRVSRETYNSGGDALPACTVQCVFTSLEMVDEKGFPTEPAVITLLQDFVSDQEDLRKGINVAKSCFQSMISELEEDNCEFTSKFAHCVRFDLEPLTKHLNTGS